jgi:putative molybdopterin biosynthesis protein
MQSIELRYALASGREAQPRLRNELIDLLGAVRQAGSISGAAKGLRLSYRHVWGELKRWEQRLGQALIVWDKGQPARLTDYGERLLLAEHLAQARLAPQISRLQAEIELAYASALDPHAQLLSLAASHDEALAQLRAACAPRRLYLEIDFCGSVEALAALKQGRCRIAGFHALPGATRDGHAGRRYRALLDPAQQVLIGFSRRTQGLAVAPGNPLCLGALADVVRASARYVNRPPAAGTRLLLDELMERDGLDAARLHGYERVEPSHAAVAQAVAAGSADAGLCIEAAARAAGLDFVPQATEDYWLVCARSALEREDTQALLAVLRSPTWREALASLAGYDGRAAGEVVALRDALPWWGRRAPRPTPR